jgi:hypothetical protein
MADPLEEIRAAASRLRELAEQLRGEDVGDDRAAELAREAAEVVSRAGNEIDRALRESAEDAPEAS